MIINHNKNQARSKQKVRLAYNRMSRWYDLIAGSSEEKFTGIGITQLKPLPGEIILEVGCGTGHGLISLARSVEQSGKIIGLDISDGMLTQSRTNIRKSEFLNNIQLHLGDGCHLPYPTKFFSAAFFSFTLELFDSLDIPLVLKECKRVLIDEGRIVIVCLYKMDSVPVQIYERFHKLIPSIIDCRPIDVQSYLIQSSFITTQSKIKKIWGLPVAIVSAVKKNKEKIR